MVPEPTFTFTIPSLQDDIPLDCRIYNPPHSVVNSLEETWSPRGAVIAHPYPPLGGCFDDGVVLSAAEEILKQGFVVGTFNFRGAGSSKGRTSWQAKSELEDYISFAGFFIYYIEAIRTIHPNLHDTITPEPTLSPTASARSTSLDTHGPSNDGMALILGGYSYGSLITTHLPTTDAIVQRFENVNMGTAEAEIRLRASNLAAQWNNDAKVYREAQRALRKGSKEKLKVSAHTIAITLGGNESEHGSRHSHESGRSLDAVRRSMDRSRKKLGFRQHSHSSQVSDTMAESLAPLKITLPRTSYLLISPLLPPMSIFVTMFSNLRMGKSPCEDKLILNPTFAIYGDDDFFTSQKKLRRWAEDMKARPGSQFQFCEVPGAGHFWREEGSDNLMRCGIREWIHNAQVNFPGDRTSDL